MVVQGIWNRNKKKMLSVLLITVLVFGLSGCGHTMGAKSTGTQSITDASEIQVFIASSLSDAMTEVAAEYNKTNPNVTIVYNADSSGTLMTQIREGYTCDIFFSAGKQQMDTLEKDGLLIDGSRADVLCNQLVVVSRKDSGTAVKGLDTLKDATSIALADGSVPVGKYTRVALVNCGILDKTDDPSAYTTEQVSKALGGVEISEQGNVSKVLTAVIEASCEVGTTYFSDIYGYEDELDILETVSSEHSGDILYPIALIANPDANDAQSAAAKDFLAFILSDEAQKIFKKYGFGIPT